MKRLDLTGQTFGKLTVLYYSHSNKDGRTVWHCKCNCGNEKDVSSKDLKRGTIRSCGCLRIETSRKRMTTHGATYTRLYNIWTSMKQRCETSKQEKFIRDYQNRGIKVCKEWHDFSVFQKWALENGYKENLSIDRIDNNKGYFPENCRWVNQKIQQNNKNTNKRLTYNNKTQTIAQWAEEIGMKYNTLDERLRKGWSIEQALITPVRKMRKRG